MGLKHFFYKKDKQKQTRKYLGGLLKIKTKKNDEKIKKTFYLFGMKFGSLVKKRSYAFLIDKIQEISNQALTEIQKKLDCYADEIRHYPEMISRLNQRNLSTAFAHQKIFSQFENCFAGKDVVLLATGPSLKDFKPMKDVIYVGVNNTFKREDLKIDYLFIHDYRGAKPYIAEANDYRKEDCQKFYGICADFIEGALVPKSEAEKAGAHYYHADYEQTPYWEPQHVYDISSQPLGCRTSITFPAMQFILWGNPRKIYLVGCDSSGQGHWNGKDSPCNADCTIDEWKKLKHLASIYYPDTEIISVNPVGLEWMFKDLFLIDGEYTEPSVDFYKKRFDDEEYKTKFLERNKCLRMDANRKDIWHPFRKEFHLDRYRFASDYIEGKVVLDIASGTGYGANYMYEHGKPEKIYGVELDVAAVAYATNKYGAEKVEFRQGSITNIPFEDNSFDVLTSFETIEHIEDDKKQLQEVQRVLKKDGYYILSTPNSWGFTEHHVKDYNYQSIRELVQQYFTIEKMYNQNSESSKIMKRQIEETTEQNFEQAECFIIIAKNNLK